MIIVIKHKIIPIERGVYRRNEGEGNFKVSYFHLEREVKKYVRRAKGNYESMIKSEIKTNPKSFYQLL